MAGIWADFPSASHGIYGDDEGALTDGIWAATSNVSLVDDPDPAIGSAGRVLEVRATTNTVCRMVLPTTQATVGQGARFWFDALPSSVLLQSCIYNFRDAANTQLLSVLVSPTGSLKVYVGATSGDSGGTLLGETDGPVITANAWWHIEVKVFFSATVGTVEIKVNGTTKLTLTGVNTSAGPCGQIAFYLRNSAADYHVKDYNLWDGSGAEVNDFQGTVTVYYRPVSSDITLGGWITSVSGSTGTPLMDGPRPANVFTGTAQLDADGSENIRIGDTYYRPTTGSVDAGTPAGTLANPWLVALGADLAASIINVVAAINAQGTPGTTYSTALTAHPTVSAVGYSTTQFVVQSDDGITTSYVCTETMTNASWASGTMSVIEPQDLSYIFADDTPPAEAEFHLQDLPDDITSIKFIVPVVRAAKVDGGDGNLQLALSPDGVSYDTGPDTPITTAFTFWGNTTAPFVSHLNPATSAAWTPAAFNGARLRIDRTL